MTAITTLDKAKRDESIATLKKHIATLPQRTIDTTHLIYGGMYSRTIFIPAGTILTGVHIKLNNICIMSGDITVTTDAGVIRLTGYHVIPAKSGLSRIGISHADTHWTTLFPTELDDVAQIEDSMSDESASLSSRLHSKDCNKYIKVEG